MDKKNSAHNKECDHEHCANIAILQTRRSPQHYQERIWLCLAHARQHNKNWNYFEDMTQREIEREYYYASLGIDTMRQPEKYQRNAKSATDFLKQLDDTLEIFIPKESKTQPQTTGIYSKEEVVALKVLALDAPFTKTMLKKAYRRMVKIHHPDQSKTGTTKAIIAITAAYKLLSEKEILKL